jgi:large subunit ribosomal protein L21
MSIYAVIETGGKQYKVAAGDTVYVERLPVKEGGAVTFDRVLMVSDGSKPRLGQPLLKGAKVTGQVVEHGRGPKLIVYKFRRRKNYRRKTGHRQDYTAVQVKDVVAP